VIAVQWSPVALQDLKQIASYLEREAGLHVAHAQIQRVLDAVTFLREFPSAGKPDAALTCRTFRAQGTPYLIFYRVYHDSIRLARVRHARRKPLRRIPR
jgi:plasmid stabilization system protein ParE